MEKELTCKLGVSEYVTESGYKGKSLELTTPKGTKIKIGAFKQNPKLIYKIVCEVEGK